MKHLPNLIVVHVGTAEFVFLEHERTEIKNFVEILKAGGNKPTFSLVEIKAISSEKLSETDLF